MKDVLVVRTWRRTVNIKEVAEDLGTKHKEHKSHTMEISNEGLCSTICCTSSEAKKLSVTPKIFLCNECDLQSCQTAYRQLGNRTAVKQIASAAKYLNVLTVDYHRHVTSSQHQAYSAFFNESNALTEQLY